MTLPARRLTEQQLRDSDLVLAMTRDHRASAMELLPAAVRYAFTLRESARLLMQVDAQKLPSGNAAARLSAAIPLAAAQRRQVSEDADMDDIADPYRRSQEHYATAFAQIQEAVLAITDLIGLANPRASE